MNDSARRIIDHADSIERIIDQEVARHMCEHLTEAQNLLHIARRAINAAENKITALSVGYSRGSLPKQEAGDQ